MCWLYVPESEGLNSASASPCPEAGRLRRDGPEERPSGPVETVGHAPRDGRRERRAEPEFRGGWDSVADASLPLFAPGPSDPAWPGIIDADPLLTPALGNVEIWNLARRNLGLPPLGDAVGRRGGMARDLDPETAGLVKSEVRRISHVLAPRVDRLRAGGNGVFPLAAAYAWRTLEALLAADRT